MSNDKENWARLLTTIVAYRFLPCPCIQSASGIAKAMSSAWSEALLGISVLIFLRTFGVFGSTFVADRFG